MNSLVVSYLSSFINMAVLKLHLLTVTFDGTDHSFKIILPIYVKVVDAVMEICQNPPVVWRQTSHGSKQSQKSSLITFSRMMAIVCGCWTESIAFNLLTIVWDTLKFFQKLRKIATKLLSKRCVRTSPGLSTALQCLFSAENWVLFR